MGALTICPGQHINVSGPEGALATSPFQQQKEAKHPSAVQCIAYSFLHRYATALALSPSQDVEGWLQGLMEQSSAMLGRVLEAHSKGMYCTFRCVKALPYSTSVHALASWRRRRCGILNMLAADTSSAFKELINSRVI